MRVLVTGGYGFIGSHICSRLIKEGHDISIIDTSLDMKSLINIKHKSYQLDVIDKKCEEVFKIGKFDIVIHLAAHTTADSSIINPYHDTSTNILGLVNILNLSHKFNVKKIIFLSSATIYGNSQSIPLKESYHGNPITPNGINKYYSEFILNKWKEIYGLDYICFRVSNVYGPYEFSKENENVISIYIKQALKNNDLVIFGDGNQTRDFIYIEDLVEAIYNSLNEIYRLYNLSTNTETSINDVINILKRYNKY